MTRSATASPEAQAARDGVPTWTSSSTNLGIFGARPVLEIDDDAWRRHFEVDVLAAVRLIRGYPPGMTDRGRGCGAVRVDGGYVEAILP